MSQSIWTQDSLAELAPTLRNVGGCLAVAAVALGRVPAVGEVSRAAGLTFDGVVDWAAGHSEAIRTGTRVALPLAPVVGSAGSG